MAATSTNPLKACVFFGATGGCANWALVLTLKAGHKATALARTPSKLTDMLLGHDVTQDTITKNLHIVQGNAKDPVAVKAAIQHRPVDLIISGLGASITDKELRNGKLTLVRDAARVLVDVIRELAMEKKPFCAMISSTGISETKDVPRLLMPMYKHLLAVPIADKKAMEETITNAGSGDSPVIDGWTIIRPTLLYDRKAAKGPGRWEVGTEEKPAIGYTIPRKDVGMWIYEELINGDVNDWRGIKASLVAH